MVGCSMLDSIDNDRPYIIKVVDVLSKEQCNSLIQRIDESQPEVATVNTSRGTKVRTDIRNNERVIFDDSELSDYLMDQVRENVPQSIHGHQLVGANERLRCYRYRPGTRFAPHKDGCFQRDENERSFYTFLVYLNEGFTGGETLFFTKPEIKIQPETGLGLLFQHPFVHEGCLVTEGVKYVVRSDIMYRK